MRHSAEFSATISSGTRGGTRRVVVHYDAESTWADSARVGFVVSKAVGGAVQRNRVKRRLRAIVRDTLEEIPDQSALVVRDLPRAAESSYAQLQSDLHTAWRQARKKAMSHGEQ